MQLSVDVMEAYVVQAAPILLQVLGVAKQETMLSPT